MIRIPTSNGAFSISALDPPLGLGAKLSFKLHATRKSLLQFWEIFHFARSSPKLLKPAFEHYLVQVGIQQTLTLSQEFLKHCRPTVGRIRHLSQKRQDLGSEPYVGNQVMLVGSDADEN